MNINKIKLVTNNGEILLAEDIDRMFISTIRKLLADKNMTIKQLSELIYADKDTLDTNFKLQRGITYSKASIFYSAVVNGKIFSSAESIVEYEKTVIDNFYTNFINAFNRNGLTYLAAEDIYGVSHSTLFCYRNRQKTQSLKYAVVLSQLMKFDLIFDFFQFLTLNNN